MEGSGLELTTYHVPMDLVRGAMKAVLDPTVFSQQLKELWAVPFKFKSPLNDSTFRVYFRALQDQQTEDVVKAMLQLEREAKAVPVPAEIRELSETYARIRMADERRLREDEEMRQSKIAWAERKAALAAELAAVEKAGPPADDDELMRRASLFMERDGRVSLRAMMQNAKHWRHEGALVIEHNAWLGTYMNDVETYLEEAARKRVRLMLGAPEPADS
jgi:hypothetical protein